MSGIGRRIPFYTHEVAIGEVLKLDIQVKDQAGTVLPLDGYTARYVLLDHQGVEVASYTPTIALDKILIRASIGTHRPGTYTHALRIKSGTGDPLVLFRGELKIYSNLAEFP